MLLSHTFGLVGETAWGHCAMRCHHHVVRCSKQPDEKTGRRSIALALQSGNQEVLGRHVARRAVRNEFPHPIVT